MKIRDLSEYGIDVKTLRERRDPLGLQENIVRADLLDEFHGVTLPYRRRTRSSARKRER